ncbi:hypothetical protein EDD22DRAFT_845457 [Suillus occidentalis]|nr:hypothetical protein EDD22DRAFT_845457 [Suillus occidentalis]
MRFSPVLAVAAALMASIYASAAAIKRDDEDDGCSYLFCLDAPCCPGQKCPMAVCQGISASTSELRVSSDGHWTRFCLRFVVLLARFRVRLLWHPGWKALPPLVGSNVTAQFRDIEQTRAVTMLSLSTSALFGITYIFIFIPRLRCPDLYHSLLSRASDVSGFMHNIGFEALDLWAATGHY